MRASHSPDVARAGSGLHTNLVTAHTQRAIRPTAQTDEGLRRTEPLIEAAGLGRTYGTSLNSIVALDNVSITIGVGEMVALMGPSGSGKSTLLTILGGLESPSSGTVTFDGSDLSGCDAKELAAFRRRDVGFVFQHYNLLSELTVVENVAAPLELDGMKRNKALELARDQLMAVGLADRAQSFPEDLSGGQQQRVAIARALVGDRRLLLADEPTGALDSKTGQAILDLLRSSATSRSAVVIVTHDKAVAAQCDRVIYIQDGAIQDEAIQAVGTEMLTNPSASPQTATTQGATAGTKWPGSDLASPPEGVPRDGADKR